MNGYHWVIIVLILFMAFWYKNPEQATGYIDLGIDKIGSVIPIGKGSTQDICPNVTSEVCGDGQTYMNSCFANQAGVTNFTFGVC